MPNPDVAWNRADPFGASNPAEPSGPSGVSGSYGTAGSPVQPVEGRWRRFTASLPMRTALLAVAAVWLLGAVWSFTEQSAFAANKGFSYPHLLPLVIDGFAVAMAGVAWAASLDARPAVAARLATVIAVAASSASIGAWAYLRTDHDLTAVVLGVAVPIAANLAFEVLLAEMRRQVQRRRGLPPPVAIPYPRLVRLALAPFRTFVEWRALVLDLTQMDLAVARPPEAARSSAPAAVPASPAAASAHSDVGTAAVPPSAGRVAAGTVPPAARVDRNRQAAARHEAPREPVGIERVRRELAQYAEVANQEPVWGDGADDRDLVAADARQFPGQGLYDRAGGNGATGHGPTGHGPTGHGPVGHGSSGNGTSGLWAGGGETDDHRLNGDRTADHEANGNGTTGHEADRHRAPARETPRPAAPRPEPSRAQAPRPGPSRAEPTRAAASRAAASRAEAQEPPETDAATGFAPAAQPRERSTRRRDLEAVPAAAPARLSAPQPAARTNAARRAVDPRVELLAAHLASTEDAGEFTGEMVGPLLNIDVAPRTGRRLLGLARELVNERARSETDPRDDELSAAIGSG